jgi:ethanolamine utilization microcompartment shell protein EutS
LGYEPGQTVFLADLVCADGQRVCRAIFREPAAVLVGVLTLQRIDPAPMLTSADISSELASLRANIEALSRRLGIVPQE